MPALLPGPGVPVNTRRSAAILKHAWQPISTNYFTTHQQPDFYKGKDREISTWAASPHATTCTGLGTFAWGSLPGPLDYGDLGKTLEGTRRLSWRWRFVKGGKRKEREYYKGRKSRTQKKQKPGVTTKVPRTRVREGSTGAAAQPHVGKWRALCTGRVGVREGSECPPYHQIGELPLLTRFPSLPGGTADNINQSYSDDYAPSKWDKMELYRWPLRDHPVPMTRNIKPWSPRTEPTPSVYLTDSERRNAFYWPYIVHHILTGWNNLIEFSLFSL